MGDFCQIREGPGCLVAVALHGGREVRPEVARHLRLPAATRRREEDPFTDRWTAIAPTRVVVRRSRFEVDCNRARDRAVYAGPKEAFGLRPWRRGLPDGVRQRSLALYDDFYRRVEDLLERKRQEHGGFLVYDLHSYNHRPEGFARPAAPAEENPEVNLGTGTLPDRWRPVSRAFLSSLRDHDFLGRSLDVRTNVRFEGGHFPTWIHRRFPESGCALAVEVKKTFMDEWTSVARRSLLGAFQRALEATTEPARRALETLR
ncbi:MAG: N-formylglutamate amidohydrolase [Thermoanaerobaculia bacterium]|nr:N-formylglutamate amidohydrolase [Thermoanaerobaculia bacterium]